MKTILGTRFLDIPDGVTVTCKARHVTVTGPRGKLERSFKHMQLEMQMVADGKKLRVDSWFANRKELAVVRTVCSHVKNMMVGVTLGYLYKMRCVSAHFPINLVLGKDKKSIEIRNFLGEKIVRKVDCYPGVELKLSNDVKDQIEISGNNIEMVSLTAARIQQSTTVKKKDIRKFLDGIYVSEKTNITVSE